MDRLERPRPAPFDRATTLRDEAADLREIDAAIELVSRGVALRVRLVDLCDAEHLAGVALARAQAAGILFSSERSADLTDLTIGPRR